MDMTEEELKEMIESLREMFDEYLDEAPENDGIDHYDLTSKCMAEMAFENFLKWMRSGKRAG